jgi:hypothetical protein
MTAADATRQDEMGPVSGRMERIELTLSTCIVFPGRSKSEQVHYDWTIVLGGTK